MISDHLNFAYLKRRVSIVTVLKTKTAMASFIKKGDQLFGPCPVHGGDNPNAFVVSLSKNIWHCFTRCNAGGDVIELVRRLYGKDYRQTAAFLSSLADTAAGFRSGDPVPYRKKCFRPFTARLPLDASTPWLHKKRINSATARRFDAGAYQGTGFLSGCIAVRLHDLLGRPIGYAGRRTDPNLAKQYGKWKLPPALPKNEILFNFHRIKPAKPNTAVVVECPWGVMRLAQLDIPAVALLGIHLSAAQLDILKTFSSIVLILDGDDAGRSATIRISNTLEPHTRIHRINLPSGLDPDDLTDPQLRSATGHFFFNQSSVTPIPPS
jgi:DNA primase